MNRFYRRHLPHLSVTGQPSFVTWRLAESLPKNRFFASDLTGGKAFVAMDSLLDYTRTGPMYLRRPEIAAMVVSAIQYGQSELGLYEAHAWVVMPNHVHLLITPRVELQGITDTLKRFTAREANRALRL